MIAAGRSAREFGEILLEKFGDTVLPYLNEFSQDVSKGRINIEGLGQSAKTAIFGRIITLQEREQMIRQAAYFRAERRGFVGGSAADDWYAAEREIDRQLMEDAGLVEKGRKILTSAGTFVEREFDEIKQLVTEWLEGEPDAGKNSEASKRKTTGVAQSTTRARP